MSWLKGARLRGAALAVALAALGACGFRPLYGDPEVIGTGNNASEELAAVHINTIPDRTGQMLHNNLLDRINAHGRPGLPRYALDITLTETRSNLGFIKDNSATLAQLGIVANYRLVDLKTKAPLQSGRSRSVTSYNIVTSDFGTLSAEKDARERAVREIADDITTKVAVFLSTRKASGS